MFNEAHIFSRNVWPDVIHLLCIWHCLNAVWRWLFASTHGILKPDRPNCLIKFRQCVYTKSDQEYETAKEELLEDQNIQKYPRYIQHLNRNYFNRPEKWSLSVRYRDQLPTHGVNTSNIVERAFGVTKDCQFGRVKAYNLPELVDITFDDHSHYSLRLTDLGNGILSAFKTSRFVAKETSLREDQVTWVCEENFVVESQTVAGKFYRLNMRSGFCECVAGNSIDQ